jgi:rubredoxin
MNAVAPHPTHPAAQSASQLAAKTPAEVDQHRRCRCGTDRTNRAASPEREYSLAGACYLLWGGTSIPTRVRFRCIHCGHVFDECTDRASLRAYIT